MQFDSHEDYNLPIAKFESMLKTNSVYFFDSSDFEHIAAYYLDEGKLSKAKKAIQIGLSQHPIATELKLLQTEIFIFENKFDLAEKMLTDIEEISPNKDEVYIQKANILSKKDRHHEAIKMLLKALANAHEALGDIYSLIGMEYLFLELHFEAKEFFVKALQEDPEDYPALYNTVFCFEFLEDYDGSISFLNQYLETNPYCEVAWLQLGKQYASKKMYKEALSAFEFAIISDDTFIGAYFEKGKVLEKLGRYNEAIDNYEFTLKLDDPTSFAYLRIGKCHEKLGNTELAKDAYYRTVHEDPLLDKGWIAITDFYYKQAHFEKANEYINKAIHIDEDNVLYWKRSAEINKQLQQFEKADVAYQRAVELGNYQLDTWISWADVLAQLNELDNAVITLLQGLEFHPDESVLEYRLAALYFIKEENTKGAYHLTNALQHNFEAQHSVAPLFPSVFNSPTVKNIITKIKKAS